MSTEDIYCTQPFDANPDVSGTSVSDFLPSKQIVSCGQIPNPTFNFLVFQVLIAFYTQGLFSIAFDTTINIFDIPAMAAAAATTTITTRASYCASDSSDSRRCTWK